MSSPHRPLLSDLKNEIRGLAADAGEMLSLRCELARLEIQADFRRLKRLAVVWGAAAVMALTALPLLVACVAEMLDGRLGIARMGWLMIFGITLLGIAALCGYVAWRRFRRRFVGLQQTLEELREDLVWVKEKMKDEE
jgi:protein-S-isoprenylcysteine O-methyltransferase Ste14